jgi:hypothetical protein
MKPQLFPLKIPKCGHKSRWKQRKANAYYGNEPKWATSSDKEQKFTVDIKREVIHALIFEEGKEKGQIAFRHNNVQTSQFAGTLSFNL